MALQGLTMPSDLFSAKRQKRRQSSKDVASNAPPKRTVSQSQDEVVSHQYSIAAPSAGERISTAVAPGSGVTSVPHLRIAYSKDSVGDRKLPVSGLW
jgi:hypothetical protein